MADPLFITPILALLLVNFAVYLFYDVADHRLPHVYYPIYYAGLFDMRLILDGPNTFKVYLTLYRINAIELGTVHGKLPNHNTFSPNTFLPSYVPSVEN